MSLAVACEMGEAMPTSPDALPNTLRLSNSPSSCLPALHLLAKYGDTQTKLCI